MIYSLDFSNKAIKQLKKLDNPTRKLIVSWLKTNIDGSENPRQQGKPLTGNLGGLWRYRVENYRIVAKIKDDKYIVLAVHIEHRSKVYKKNNLRY